MCLSLSDSLFTSLLTVCSCTLPYPWLCLWDSCSSLTHANISSQQHTPLLTKSEHLDNTQIIPGVLTFFKFVLLNLYVVFLFVPQFFCHLPVLASLDWHTSDNKITKEIYISKQAVNKLSPIAHILDPAAIEVLKFHFLNIFVSKLHKKSRCFIWSFWAMF